MTRPTLEVRSALDGSVLASPPVDGTEQVRAAVARARTAQPEWARLGLRERARRMREVARLMGARGDELAASVRSETGKPPTEALAEVVVSVDLIRYYVRVAPRHLRPRRVSTGWILSKAGTVERVPRGVIGAITPWNYPLILALDCITPALFAGNGVVVKPSELTPVTTLLLPALLEEAGIPKGLVQVVTGDGSTGRALVQSGVDHVVFTGSTATGRKVMEAASATLTPVTLELGGKDPAIVLEDADLERAARGIVFGAFFNAGQTCISVERVYVVRSVFQPFVERVSELVHALRAGQDEHADLGPLVSRAQIAVVERHVADALEKGARVLSGGRRSTPDGSVYLPTVLVDVDESMAVMRDESFGPLLPIAPVDDEEEAVRRANDSRYGLFASVWTGDRARGLRVARRLRAGGVSVNDVLTHYVIPSLPMGGVGESGFGRRHGVEALDEMTRSRTALVDRWGLKREPFWFPYSKASARLWRALLAWRARGGLRGIASLAGRLASREG